MVRTSVYFILLAVVFVPMRVLSQSQLDLAVQSHVDHIEVFIDRFNYDEASEFYQFVQNTYPDQKIDRTVVLNSLFNRRLNRTNEVQRQKFIKTVTDLNRPVILEIYDALWYASVPATVTVDKVKIGLGVTLEIQLNHDYSIEWSVIGVKSDAVEGNVDTKGTYISVSSHATYFPELRYALASAEILESISSDSQKRSTTWKYCDLIEGKKVTDVRIGKGISYHFMQIAGWIMVVEYAPYDDSLNTGWLISEVIEVDTFLEKRVYQFEELGISSLF